MAIISASDYKTLRGISGTTYDAQLAVIVPQALKMIETYTNRVFDQATFTELQDGADCDTLVLRNEPIVSITSIKRLDPSGTVEWTYNTTDYTFEASTGKVRLAYGDEYGFPPENGVGMLGRAQWQNIPRFPRGFQNIQVVYVGGYGSGAYPADIQWAAENLVDFMLSKAIQALGLGPLQSENFGMYSYSLAAPKTIKSVMMELFGQFRRPPSQ